MSLKVYNSQFQLNILIHFLQTFFVKNVEQNRLYHS